MRKGTRTTATYELMLDGVTVVGTTKKGDIFAIDRDDLPLIENETIGMHGRDPYFTIYYGAENPMSLSRYLLGSPRGLDVDHINTRNKWDNRRDNLRTCTRSENIQNQVATGKTSKYKGVYYNRERGKYYSAICVMGKRKFLGRFANDIAAAKAYDVAAKLWHGEYARTNEDEGAFCDKEMV